MNSPWKFALLLAALLWGIILLINWAGPASIPISVQQLLALEETGNIRAVKLYRDRMVVQLHMPVFIRTEDEQVRGDQVAISRELLGRGEIGRWIDRGATEIEEGLFESWSGEIAISFFILVGIAFIVQQIRQDRSTGLPRRRIKELDEAYRAGQIGEEDYRKRLDELLPEL